MGLKGIDADPEYRRVFKIYNFNEKTKQVDHIQTLKTKPLTKDRFQEIIKEEMAKPFNKNACYEVVS